MIELLPTVEGDLHVVLFLSRFQAPYSPLTRLSCVLGKEQVSVPGRAINMWHAPQGTTNLDRAERRNVEGG